LVALFGRLRNRRIEHAGVVDDRKRVIVGVRMFRGKDVEHDRRPDHQRQHEDADEKGLRSDEREEFGSSDDEYAAHRTASCAGAFISSAVGRAMRTKMSCSDGFFNSKWCTAVFCDSDRRNAWASPLSLTS